MRILLAFAMLPLIASCQERGESSKATPAGSAEVPQVVADEKERTDDEIRDGWVSLFDGETLFGWHPNDDPKQGGVNWGVQEGAIAADAGQPGLLLTSVPFADFELRCDFWLADGGNSGIFLRTVARPTDAAKDCYELNICNPHPDYPTGSLVGRVKPRETFDGDGEWRTYTVRAEGPRITVRLDDQPVIDFTDRSDHVRLAGYIGLQKNEGAVKFRNIALRPLGLKPIFDGKDLSGWRKVPGSKSTFQVQDGTIHVTGGRGYLETERTWGDFVLQAEAKTNAKGLNSGIFFRAMPGTEAAPANGYEYQIQYGYKDDDRSKPADFGTGGIYRRVPARRVVGDDRQWNTLTLVAHGPHIATWVNGQPVVAWTDTRKPSDNPRDGLRLKPGHLSLQGHDPTTDLDFRKLRIAGFPDPNDAGP